MLSRRFWRLRVIRGQSFGNTKCRARHLLHRPWGSSFGMANRGLLRGMTQESFILSMKTESFFGGRIVSSDREEYRIRWPNIREFRKLGLRTWIAEGSVRW